MSDPVMAAAAAAAGLPVPADGAAPALPGTAAKKSYPSPTKYEAHPWARKMDKFLDKAGDPDPDSLVHAPASTVMVGECAMATGEAWGLKAGGESTPIHPAWLLLFAVIAYGAMVGVHHWLGGKKEKPAPAADPERRDRLAGLA